MTATASVASYDTYISEQYNTSNFGAKPKMRLSGGTGTHRFGFLYFAGMPPRGASIFTATLSLYVDDGSQWSGTSNITVKRVTGTWSESKLTWDRSGTSQLATGSGSGTVAVSGTVVTGQRIDIDVSSIMSDVSSGTAWFGLRVGIDGGATIRDIQSSEASNHKFRPSLNITWARPPSAPTSLAPSGGLATSLSKPVLTWVYKDADGDPQAELQVQTSTSTDFTSPEFDSGWIVSGTPQLDLSATAYGGVTDGDTKYWRVRVQDDNGLTSDWSATQNFVRHVKGALVINNPPDGGFVEETTPPISTTLTGQAQAGIAYELDELQADGSYKNVWKLGRFAAAATDGTPFAFDIPAGYLKTNSGTYRLTVQSYDAVDRIATPGDPTYVAGTTTFTFNRSAVPVALTTLTVTPAGPGLAIAFVRATEPDYFALKVDGVYIYDRLDPDLFRTSAAPVANFLTGDNSDFEGGIGNWVNQTNATLAQDASHAKTGTHALKMTATTTGNMGAASCSGPNILLQGMPISAGQTAYTSGWFQAGTTIRACNMGFQFYDASGTSLGTQFNTSANNTTGGMTQYTYSFVAPATSAWVRAIGQVHSAATSEVHYLDDVWLSVGAPVSGPFSYGFTWYGAVPNSSHVFEVEAVVSDAGVLKHSETNPTVTLAAYVQGIWLVDDLGSPFAQGTSVGLVRLDGQEAQDFTIGESSNVYYPIGARAPVTITDSIRGAEGTIAGTVTDDELGYVTTFRWMKQPEQAGRQLRLVYGTTNIPVTLGAAHLTPNPYTSEVSYTVSVDVAQVGEFD